MNESIYYTVDAIHNAISENRKIKFQYYQWNIKKEMELRHNGAWYHISPWGLSWDDENYYLAGVVIDRFGKDVMMIPTDGNRFTVSVNVRVSRQFMGWVFSLGEKVKIIGPDLVVEQMREEVSRLVRQYG